MTIHYKVFDTYLPKGINPETFKILKTLEEICDQKYHEPIKMALEDLDRCSFNEGMESYEDGSP